MMKKKGARDIPDFSRKPRVQMGKPVEATKNVAPPKPRDPAVKPVSMPPKGGQRGR
jgi:hypothetical protein